MSEAAQMSRHDLQFRSLFRLQSKGFGVLAQMDADRRHRAANRMEVEAQMMLSTGFLYGHTLSDLAQRVRFGAAAL